MVRTAVAGLALVALLGLGSAAQETPTPKKFSNVKWFEMTHVDYYPHKAKEALEIVYDYFFPAGRAAKIDLPRILEYSTGGEWDLTLIFPMSEGPAELEWEMSPDGVAWMNALAERLGSPEEVEELLDKYHAMINRFETHIVREKQHEWTREPATKRRY